MQYTGNTAVLALNFFTIPPTFHSVPSPLFVTMVTFLKQIRIFPPCLESIIVSPHCQALLCFGTTLVLDDKQMHHKDSESEDLE